MIRFAADKDHPQLMALWQVCFGDSETAIRFYFANRHQNQNMLVYEENGIIAGMLTMLPVQLAFGSFIQNGRYIYAVATAPQLRGQGVSSQLLEACHTWMQNNNETASVLVPASQSLFDYYEKRGFETLFYVDNIKISPAGLPAYRLTAECTPCSAEEFYRLRNAAFADSSLFVKWGIDALSYLIKGAETFGDGVYYFRSDKGEGCAFCGWRDRTIFIREIALLHMDLYNALSILHHELGAESYSLRLPAGSVTAYVPQAFGMIHYLGDKPVLEGKSPYLSLVLD